MTGPWVVPIQPSFSFTARSPTHRASARFPVKPIDPDYVIRGQYAGYRNGPGVPPDSRTETFIAMRASIDNRRWSGVAFSVFLRTAEDARADRAATFVASGDLRSPTVTPRSLGDRRTAALAVHDHQAFDIAVADAVLRGCAEPHRVGAPRAC